MSDVNNDQPKSYCTNCGAEVREGNVFCHVCGASLEPARPQPERPAASQTTSGTGTGVLGARISVTFGRLVDWFWSLPNLIKLAVALVVVLVIAIFLSPVMAFVFGVVAFGCIAYAIFQLYRRRPSALPFGVAAASAVLFFVFIGVSSFIYGGSNGNGDSSNSNPDSDLSSSPPYDYVAPGLEEVAEDWYLSEADVPLLLPGYLPFPIKKVDADPDTYVSDLSGAGYSISGPPRECGMGTIKCTVGAEVIIGDQLRTSRPPGVDTIEVNGRNYYLDPENSTANTLVGIYSALLWVELENGQYVAYDVSLIGTTPQGDPLPQEDFFRMIDSLAKIDPKDSQF